MNSAKENRWKLFFGSRLFIAVAVFVVFLVILGYVRAYYNDFQVKQEISHLQDEARNMEVKKLKLLDVLRYVKSDDFVEEKARTELNMIKPGEKLAIIQNTGSPQTGGQEKTGVVGLDNVPNYIKWWKYFFRQEE
jgi:cell division protein FtsB